MLAAANINAHDAVLDGEIVFLGGDGRSRFLDLMRRRSGQQFVAFDLAMAERPGPLWGFPSRRAKPFSRYW
jgi:ATP-dependent DNA ligase